MESVPDRVDPVTYEDSSKGKRLALYQGYIFHLHRSSGSVKTWRCAKYRTEEVQCRCLLKVSDALNKVLEVGTHSHFPNPIDIPRKKFMAQLKRSTINSGSAESPSSIIESTLEKYPDVLKQYLPKTESLRRTVRNNIKMSGSSIRPPTPPLESPRLQPAVLEIPPSLQIPPKSRVIGHDNKPFLQYDSGVGVDRILIFATELTLDWLNNSSAIFFDSDFPATYSTSTFHQILVITGIQGDTPLPCVYALMADKRSRTFDRVIEQLKKLCPQLNPPVIMADFEFAALNCLQRQFPASRTSGGFFNFRAFFLNKCQESSDLCEMYKNNLELRKLLALAFVPTNKVIEYFDMLLETPFFNDIYEGENFEAGDSKIDALCNFLWTFESTWIRKFSRHQNVRPGQYSVEIWNCFNNIAEGWDESPLISYFEGFRKDFEVVLRARPNLRKLIEDLKLKHEVTEQVISDRGNPPKRAKYENSDFERLHAVVNDFLNLSPINYLDAVAQCLGSE